MHARVTRSRDKFFNPDYALGSKEWAELMR